MKNIALYFIVFMFACGATQAFDPPKGMIRLDGKSAPPLKLKNMDNQEFDIQSVKGKWLLVHFWATWCGPCKKELPTFEGLQSMLGNKDWHIIYINTSETDDTVFSFLPTIAATIDPLMDRDGQITELWQPRGLPATYVVDPTGKLRYIALGGRDWKSKSYLTFLKSLPLNQR